MHTRLGRITAGIITADVVAQRTTGLGEWDGLGFGQGMNFDLSQWKTEASEGVQGDA